MRRTLIILIAVAVAVGIVGTLGQVPHWGDLAAPAFGLAGLSAYGFTSLAVRR